MVDFNLIKGRIHKFTRSSIVERCIELLIEAQKEKSKTYPFWNLLVLIKWAHIYTKNSPFRLKATAVDIIQTLALMERFEGEHKVVDFSKGIERGMRIIAFQQFWFQDVIHRDDFARQVVLYTQLRSTLNIDSKFKDLTGLSVIEFLRYTHFTFLYLNLDTMGLNVTFDGILYDNYWEALEEKYSPDRTNEFRYIMTLRGTSDIKSLQKMNNEAYQLYETNFWHLKPFFHFKGQTRILHKTIFNQTAKHFIYDYLKHALPEVFPTEFGSRMEKYVELGLKESNANYLNEGALKKKYPKLVKSADYLVNDNILIECKAIELHPRSGIIRTQKVLTNEFATSIIKAYKQLLSTATSIEPKKQYYGIVITYKDTYVGFGKDAWDEFLEKPMLEYLRENNLDIEVLPPENLCFISIENWDHLIQSVTENQGTIESILQTAFRCSTSTNSDEKILLFEQALKKYFPIKKFSLSFLTSAYDSFNVME